MRVLLAVFFAAALITAARTAPAAEEYRFDFEDGDDGWMIPDWALSQKDHKAESCEASSDFASSGKQSLKIVCDFSGTVWQAALVEKEFEKPIDLYGYHSISVDVYLPRNAPKELMQARMILTVGDGWFFTEQKIAEPLKNGKWTTLSARLESYEVPSPQWKGRNEKRLFLNIRKVKKVAVRIEYDIAPPQRLGPKYHGPIYIDNMVIKPGTPEDLPPAQNAGVLSAGGSQGYTSSVNGS